MASTLENHTAVSAKLSISDTLDNLDNFDIVYGTPSIESGQLVGEGVVRFNQEALTDSHRAEAVIGTNLFGTTRLIICGNKTFTRYYGIEIQESLLGSNCSIIKGNAASSVESGGGLLSVLFGLFFSLFSVFSQDVSKHAGVLISVGNGDKLGAEYNEETSTITAYINDVEVTSLEVPRGEIPHGKGQRWAGLAVGVDIVLGILNVGPLMTSFGLEDI